MRSSLRRSARLSLSVSQDSSSPFRISPTEKSVNPDAAAIVFANSVLPVPARPTSRMLTPLTGAPLHRWSITALKVRRTVSRSVTWAKSSKRNRATHGSPTSRAVNSSISRTGGCHTSWNQSSMRSSGSWYSFGWAPFSQSTIPERASSLMPFSISSRGRLKKSSNPSIGLEHEGLNASQISLVREQWV